MASLVPLIDTFRGGALECRHFGAVAVAGTSGRVPPGPAIRRLLRTVIPAKAGIQCFPWSAAEGGSSGFPPARE